MSTRINISHAANDVARAVDAIVKQTTGAELPMEACVRIAACIQIALDDCGDKVTAIDTPATRTQPASEEQKT